MADNETNFGPYRIEEEVGRGGNATVYRACQPSMNRTVAIKLLPREFMHDGSFLARFRREIELAAAISHPHILPIYDFGEYDEQPFIAMRFMACGSLGDQVAEGPVTLDEAVRIMAQAAEALDYLHSKGIIHRDLKVDNILLDEGGNAYLTDFGVARLAESQTMLTGSRVVGTPSHMAPEMFQQGAPTPQVDIYALGVTLYHMLTGHLPFEANTPMAYMERHLFDAVPGLRTYRKDLPREVDDVIAHAMAKEPTDRYATAAEMVRDLKRAAQPGRRRLPALIGVGVAVIAAGVVGVLALTGQFSAGPNSIADALPTETATSTQPPTETTMPTATSTTTPEPTLTTSAEPAGPPPVIGGGTGLIAFGRNNQTYLIDAGCVVSGGVNCNPNPQIIPPIGGMPIALLASNGTGGGNGYLDTGLQLWSANGQYLGIAARVLGPSSAVYAADITCIETGTCDSGLIAFPFDTTQGAVSWAPDGVRFAVNSDFEGYDGSLTIADVACLRDGGEDCIRRVIQENGAISNIVWSHDGNKIAYRTDSWFSLSVDGGLLNRTDLTAWATSAQYLSWMPGDEQIVYLDQTSLTDVPGSPESKYSLMIGPADGTPATFLTTLFEGNAIFGDVSYLPAAMLSPDGTRVAIATQDENFDYRDLYIVNLGCMDGREEDFLACERPPYRAADTPYVTQITDGPADITTFNWSPDGQWIAFVRSASTTFVTSSDDTRNNSVGDLYVVNVDQALGLAPEEAVIQLTRLGTVNYVAPQWQPITD